ncbi:hypothetical protein SAMN02910418_01050 [Bowdeniella nasicola]|uniref:Uncharacterized protein n=1 Tax=Bowdeniella nasicola TaxID=208480 RepID=A0A1H3YZP9_9ACTO|nr:hypothetical protein [Bowdeniella nasicola]SEA16969.1 hypothetical protein SAMN02910418_01050 [Bowdeniella nasicola]
MADSRESVVPHSEDEQEHEVDERPVAEEYQPDNPRQVFEADPADVADQATEEPVEDEDARDDA